MKRLFLILTLILPAFFLHAKEQFIYTSISYEENLTSTVNSIYKEPDGIVWIGTPNGLYSFNGNSLRHHDDPALKGRRIFATDTDMNDRFWVLTDRGAFMKNSDDDSFIPMGGGDEPLYCLYKDSDRIWMGSNRKLFTYTEGDSSISLFKDLTEKPSFLIRSINRIDEKTLLCSSHNGLIFLDIETGEIRSTPFDIFNEVTSVLTDSRGRIWISFYNNGIRVFEKDGTLVKEYTTSNSSLSNNVVLCMTERDSMIWAGTDGGGINIIDTGTGDIRVLSHIAGDSSSLPAHSIKSIYTDDHGNIWAGSIRDGLIRISYSGMKTYADSHIGLNTGLSNPTVLCLYQSRYSSDIYIGTDGEGLNRFNPETGEFTHYPATLKTKIVSIADYSEDELALSSYSDRIWIFNRHTGSIRPLYIDDRNINYQLKYAGRSINLANEADGSLLLIGNTVNRFDKSTGKCTRIDTEEDKTAEGNFLLISSTEEGLWFHDYYELFLLPEGGSSLQSKGRNDKHVINCGHIGQDGVIWLGTEEGLCRFNITDGTFSHVKSTLLSSANSVVCDRHSRIWIGTNNGLYAYLADSGSFALFGSSDGASPNEYLSKPHLISREGDVYLGGVQGLLCIDKDFVIDTTDEPLLSLQGMTVDHEKAMPDEKGTVRIPRHSKSMEISVTSSERDIFREKVYRFMIPDIGAVYESKSPVLTLHTIPKPGRHDVLVSCTRRNGEWSDPVNLFTVRIPQPWYLSAWFLSLVSLFVILTVFAVQISTARRRNNRLQLALKEQEQQIYEDKVRFLINISHELRTPLTLIMAPLKRILKGMGPDQEHYPALSRIYRQSRRMRDLLNMVLDLRKMEVGKNSLRIENADFNRWILNSIEDIVNEEHAEEIEIVTSLDPSVGMVDFDKMKCDTVLMNMVMNAIKHSSSGDTITISTVMTEDGMVRTSISDEGAGLKDIDPEKMFTRFYQSNSEQYGSGIGLSYSKILVELHGGRIGASDNPDKGATFWWEIPAKSVLESNETPARAYLNELIGQEAADNVNLPEARAVNTAEKKIMLVDDNQDLLDFLKEAMTAEFAEIMTACGGNKALSILSAGKLPDIIVSDVNMPDGDGYTFCSRLKEDERFSHIPVVLLTARGEQQSQSDSYKAGADAYMAKPFEIDTLIELIRNLLRRKEEIRKRYLDADKDATAGYSSDEESFILRLNRIISENISNPELDQQLICRELGVSRALLYNKMKTITGAGAKEYITRIRIDKAKSLIENSSLTIAEISDMTGFASQSYFSTAFKNATGMTPSQYKQEHRK